MQSWSDDTPRTHMLKRCLAVTYRSRSDWVRGVETTPRELAWEWVFQIRQTARLAALAGGKAGREESHHCQVGFPTWGLVATPEVLLLVGECPWYRGLEAVVLRHGANLGVVVCYYYGIHFLLSTGLCRSWTRPD